MSVSAESNARLDLPSEPHTGENCIHGAASPLEADSTDSTDSMDWIPFAEPPVPCSKATMERRNWLHDVGYSDAFWQLLHEAGACMAWAERSKGSKGSNGSKMEAHGSSRLRRHPGASGEMEAEPCRAGPKAPRFQGTDRMLDAGYCWREAGTLIGEQAFVWLIGWPLLFVQTLDPRP